MLFLQYLRSAFRTRYHESAREKVGRLAVSIPFVRAQYLKQFHKDLVTFQEKSQKRWETFGAPITELPEDGWTPASIKQWFDRLVKVTNRPLEHHQYSGMIYSNSINDSGDAEEIKEVDVEYMQHDLTTPEAMSALSAELKELYTYTFRKSYLWNQLHGNEFGIGDWMSYQVVQMVSTMFGGNPSECNGFVTTGGTESLMVAMRSYRNWGMMSRGLAPGESTIICADTIHAAVKKAGDAYHMHTILVPTSDDGDMDLAAMRAAIKKHGRNVVCVIGSAPNYPTGVLDPIAELAAIAKEFGIGLHVDACLGGFIVNNLPSIDANFLAIDGVTSLSTDTHKNGWAPKGSSVLVTKPLYNPVHGTYAVTNHV